MTRQSMFRVHRNTEPDEPCDEHGAMWWHLDDAVGNLIACRPTWNEIMARADFYAYGTRRSSERAS
ncbi:hypothetical protein FK530_22890 [Tsukamurella conjunctivitidis]|uniref:Uncharacterized protein n=1 Tax=Tsukamurella conjunctivitidis TaxID=2592068 RepID=A0A5C5RR78_9ACTN|nr:hypothetical protein [Tsukamurella conjunctivitidis]TWS25569.1 hypothetical protein FK530_22890 [Tsukamurella conjunctivitidis]